MKKPTIGIALGSGSARGWAHIGIIRALEEKGIHPQVVAGASVGSMVGAAYASKQLDTLEKWVRKLTKKDVWGLLDTTFRGGGVMRGNKLMRAIGEQIEDLDIEDLPIAFAAVAADLHSGQEIWLREGPMLSAVRASSGLPGLFTPMWYQEKWMIDGGVVNPVPVSLCRAMGADYVIAVNLNGHYSTHAQLMQRFVEIRKAEEDEEREEENDSNASWTSLERWSGMMDGLVDALKSPPSKHKEPGLFDVIANSVNIMQDRITRSRMVGDPPNMELSPDLGHFQLMDFHRADEAMEVGRKTVARASDELDEIRKLLA
jgi:NTE family protein